MRRHAKNKKKGAHIATKYSDIVWNNDDAIMDRINIVKKVISVKNNTLEEKALLDSNSKDNVNNPLNIEYTLKKKWSRRRC